MNSFFADDEHDRALVSNVRPPGWENPEPRGRYNLVVIGAGTAGLVSAAGAAGLGAKVALVESRFLGGDCLNVGCVPSKAVIRSSRAARDVESAGDFAVRTARGPEADFPRVMERMRRLRARISRHDSADRFKGLGVDVYLGTARFSGRDSVEVDGKVLRFDRAVIATGSRPTEPPIEGLREAGYLTNETVFSLTTLPKRLAVIGGGPIGVELSQAFQRLGSRVALFQSAGRILDREDADAAQVLQRALLRDGIELFLDARVRSVAGSDDGKLIVFHGKGGSGQEERVTADEILVGVGRTPNVDGLNLEAAGVEYDRKSGVHVNDCLQTANPRIYSAGDVCSRYKFTHMADAAARIVIRNALFGGREKFGDLTVPWVTYTDPEIAHVGMYEEQAARQGVAVETFVKPLREVDRAVLDGEEEGFVKVHVRKGADTILGATIVARHAGEMISELSLAVASGIGLKSIARVIHPYPTQAEAIRQVADMYNRTRLTERVKSTLAFWFKVRRTESFHRISSMLRRFLQTGSEYFL